MKVAIVHYHLRRGGVTRVIEHTQAALRSHPVDTLICAGEAPDGADPDTHRVCPLLRYEGLRPRGDENELADLLEDGARARFGGPPDLWHVHNHALGKNVLLPGALRRLAERGHRLLLHIHDFAEDGRPDLFKPLTEHIRRTIPGTPASAALYPCAPHVQYAVLTRRDADILARAGARPDTVHILPNAVALEAPPSDADELPDSESTLFLYPTRAIRRKNLGEFLLWASLARPGEPYAVTLAPQNPAAQGIYRNWVSFAKRRGLPVEFEYGRRFRGSFFEMLKAARAIVTTSITEGFGLAFLEPFLAGRPVLGRNLPDITADFTGAGIHLASLYDALWIPAAWIDWEAFRGRMEKHLHDSYAAYGRKPANDARDRALASACRGDHVEFGRLDESLQQQAIDHLLTHPPAREQLPFRHLAEQLPDRATVVHNREIVRERFNLDAYGERLYSIYRALAATEPGPVESLDGEAILDSFLAPERFSLLQSPL